VASENKAPGVAFALLAIAATATLAWFGNGLDPIWPLMWIAVLPVLLYASRSSWWSTAVVAFSAWLLGCTNMWHYTVVLGAAPSLWVRIFSGAALIFTLAVLLFRALVRREAYWSAVLAFPATWVSFEYVNNLLSVHGTAGSLSYSQLKFLPLLQLASVAGPWGITFVLLLFPSAIAVGICLWRSERKRAFRIVGVSLSVIGVILIFGVVRLSLPPPGQRVRVGLIASDERGNADVTNEGPPTARLLSNYANQAEALATEGARVIVMPEKLGVVIERDARDVDSLMQALADKTNAVIVVGVVNVDPPVKYNQARVYRPHIPLLTYNKEHMLPPFESQLKPGTSLTVMSKVASRWGIEICKDMDFTPLSRKYGSLGVGLMLVPGWDFNLDRAWHGHMAIMRAVESGFGLVRAAKNGYLTVTDNRGRVLAERRSDSAPFATLLADVPEVHDATIYLLLGDWFAWLSLAILSVTVIQAYQSRKTHAG
jgi:apolipoprotein N-acyltransferase